jgi:hypothetical protein
LKQITLVNADFLVGRLINTAATRRVENQNRREQGWEQVRKPCAISRSADVEQLDFK